MAQKGIPSDVLALLAAADKRKGLPAGTMRSVMEQETGGQFEKFLADPAAYHYAPDATGKRIAPHTGKVSTAFGPFGILESTAADPGYGVAPLKDKSLAEQIRFATDYLDARSTSAGSLQAGLAGYGEGEKYSRQVARRRDSFGGQGPDGAREQVATASPPPTPMPAAAAAVPAVVPEAVVPAPAVAAAPVQPPGNPWQDFLTQVAAKPEVQPQALAAYGQQGPQVPMGVQRPDFPMQVGAAGSSLRPDFRSFLSMKRWA